MQSETGRTAQRYAQTFSSSWKDAQTMPFEMVTSEHAANGVQQLLKRSQLNMVRPWHRAIITSAYLKY